jgi:hypothetical protein
MTDELSEILELTDTQLLERLGALLLDDGLGFGLEDPASRRNFAERWLAGRWDRIRDQICGQAAVQIMTAPELGDIARDAAELADFVALAVGRIPANTVTVIILRRGLDTLCR